MEHALRVRFLRLTRLRLCATVLPCSRLRLLLLGLAEPERQPQHLVANDERVVPVNLGAFGRKMVLLICTAGSIFLAKHHAEDKGPIRFVAFAVIVRGDVVGRGRVDPVPEEAEEGKEGEREKQRRR